MGFLSSANAIEVVRKLLHSYIKNENPPAAKGLVGWAACKFVRNVCVEGDWCC